MWSITMFLVVWGLKNVKIYGNLWFFHFGNLIVIENWGNLYIKTYFIIKIDIFIDVTGFVRNVQIAFSLFYH
jgi:hypothetical protein